MNEQMIIWWAIVGIIAAAFLYTAITKYRKGTGVKDGHILEMASDYELMGMSYKAMDDDNDFEDL